MLASFSSSVFLRWIGCACELCGCQQRWSAVYDGGLVVRHVSVFLFQNTSSNHDGRPIWGPTPIDMGGHVTSSVAAVPTCTSQIVVHIQFGACLGVSIVAHDLAACILCISILYETRIRAACVFVCLCLGFNKLVPVARPPLRHTSNRGVATFGAWLVM